MSRISSGSVVPLFRRSSFRLRELSSVDGSGLWWIGPSAPSGAGAALSAAGLSVLDDMTMMSAPLDAVPAGLDTGADLRRVVDADGLRSWAAAYAGGHGHPADIEHGWYEVLSSLDPAGPLRHYLATYEGEPVASASVFLAEGVAGLYSVATPPPWRGRGFGTAVTQFALRDARAAGFTRAVLGAEPGAVSLYRRLGFVAEGEMLVYG